MTGVSWSESVALAVRRLAARNGSLDFTREQLLREELPRIIAETGSRGATPEMTLSRLLQEMPDRGEIDFFGRGRYRLLDAPLSLAPALSSRGIVHLSLEQVLESAFDRLFTLPLSAADLVACTIGEWVIYHCDARGCFALARIEQIVRNPADRTALLALIAPGSLLEFGEDVPDVDTWDGSPPIRLISNDEFDRIVAVGLADEALPLPRVSDVRSPLIKEDSKEWAGPVERATALASRKVRDPQFRKRVLLAYDRRCALTGMQLINGGGRAEAQAAHIMSVEAGGPDMVRNGIALSGTVHWMFDRGLISLSDSGEILLADKLGEADPIERLMHPDRRAHLPDGALRPHERFLAWHREFHGFG